MSANSEGKIFVYELSVEYLQYQRTKHTMVP